VNQDFLISNTGGMARRLVRLASCLNVVLDPAIIARAETDLVDMTGFTGRMAMNPSECTAVQSILDYGLRCILPYQNNRGQPLALIAAKIANIDTVVVLGSTGTKRHWHELANQYGVNEFIFIQSNEEVDADAIRNHRHGLLIIDAGINLNGVDCSLLPTDFEKTILLSTRRIISDFGEVVSVLFPGAPIDILASNILFRQKMMKRGWKTDRPEDLAFLLNIVTDLLFITKTVDYRTTAYDNLERDLELGHLRLG
jgi:hypothetical protein